MSKKEFAEFISRQGPPISKEEKPIDWAAEKKAWLQNLSALYRMVEAFLREFIDSGQIALKYNDIELSEENIGRYTVSAMTLTFGTNRVTLTPIGTLLIGTAGRVDMTGPKGTVPLILADKDSAGLKVEVRMRDPNAPAVEEVAKPINWEWKVVVINAPPMPYRNVVPRTVPRTVPRMTYVKLTQETFFDALMEVSDGYLSGKHLTIEDLFDHYTDLSASLRIYFSAASPEYVTMFAFEPEAYVQRRYRDRQAEVELSYTLSLLASLEADLKRV